MVEQKLVMAKLTTDHGVVEEPDMNKLFDAGWTITQIQALPFNAHFHHVIMLLERDLPPPRQKEG